MLEFLGWKVHASLFILSRFSGVSLGEHSGVLQAQWTKNSPRSGTLRAEKSKRQANVPEELKIHGLWPRRSHRAVWSKE